MPGADYCSPDPQLRLLHMALLFPSPILSERSLLYFYIRRESVRSLSTQYEQFTTDHKIFEGQQREIKNSGDHSPKSKEWWRCEESNMDGSAEYTTFPMTLWIHLRTQLRTQPYV